MEDRLAALRPPKPKRSSNWTCRSPIRSGRRIDAVELHRCTFWNDTPANKVYVHMCHNGIPVTVDDLYFGRARWGDTIVQGDGLWWENIDIQHVRLTLGAGMLVEPTGGAHGHQEQRLPSAACRDGRQRHARGGHRHRLRDCPGTGPRTGVTTRTANTSGLTARSCFNASGEGTALHSWRGRQRRVLGTGCPTHTPHRSLERRLRGRREHPGRQHPLGVPEPQSLERGGTGGVIRGNVSANSQDIIHLSLHPFDRLTVENNLFLHDALFWISYNQDGGTPTTAWTFRNNIAASLIIEDLTYQGLTSNCNLWIKNYRGRDTGFVSMDNPNYSGGAVFSHTSLADFRAAHPPLDRNSRELPASKWTDGTQFANFVSQRYPTFSFDPAGPSAEALNMPGCGRVGPSASPSPDGAAQCSGCAKSMSSGRCSLGARAVTQAPFDTVQKSKVHEFVRESGFEFPK